MQRPPIELTSTVLGAPDARGLASFYERLLGWRRAVDESDWVILTSGDGAQRLSFQTEDEHVAPVWPASPGDQQMQVHLDIAVVDLDEGVAWAESCGARVATHQPQPTVRVAIDPAGHPFCLFAWDGLARGEGT